jgi:hypothetical protein
MDVCIDEFRYAFSEPICRAATPYPNITNERRRTMVKKICYHMQKPDYYTFDAILFDNSKETIIMYREDTIQQLYTKVYETFMSKRLGDHFAYAPDFDEIPPPGKSNTKSSFQIKDIFLYNKETNESFCLFRSNQPIYKIIEEQSKFFEVVDPKNPIYRVYVVDQKYYDENYLPGTKKCQSCVIA